MREKITFFAIHAGYHPYTQHIIAKAFIAVVHLLYQ